MRRLHEDPDGGHVTPALATPLAAAARAQEVDAERPGLGWTVATSGVELWTEVKVGYKLPVHGRWFIQPFEDLESPIFVPQLMVGLQL